MARFSSGVWGAARPSEEAVLIKRSSAVLPKRNSVAPNKPLPAPAALADMSPKETAALLRRVVRFETIEVEGGGSCNAVSGADLVAALVQHRKLPRSEAVEAAKVLLATGYIASVGLSGSFGEERLFSFVVLPELSAAGRGLEHGVVAWEQAPAAELRPLEDVRTLVAAVLGSAWRFDYKAGAPYAAYFVQITEGQNSYTVTRRFADLLELHRLLCKKYAARVLPVPPKEKKSADENRAALQAHLVALVDCRFLAEEPEFVRFFRDMSADETPLLVGRGALVPLEEAFLLLSAPFRDVAVREQAVARLVCFFFCVVCFVCCLSSVCACSGRKTGSRWSCIVCFWWRRCGTSPSPARPCSTLCWRPPPPAMSLPRSCSGICRSATLSFSSSSLSLISLFAQVERLNGGGPPLAQYELALVLLQQQVRPELAGEFLAQQHVVSKLAETVGAVANSKRDRPVFCHLLFFVFDCFFARPRLSGCARFWAARLA